MSIFNENWSVQIFFTKKLQLSHGQVVVVWTLSYAQARNLFEKLEISYAKCWSDLPLVFNPLHHQKKNCHHTNNTPTIKQGQVNPQVNYTDNILFIFLRTSCFSDTHTQTHTLTTTDSDIQRHTHTHRHWPWTPISTCRYRSPCTDIQRHTHTHTHTHERSMWIDKTTIKMTSMKYTKQ